MLKHLKIALLIGWDVYLFRIRTVDCEHAAVFSIETEYDLENEFVTLWEFGGIFFVRESFMILSSFLPDGIHQTAD